MHREQRRTRKLKSRDRELPPLPPIDRSSSTQKARSGVLVGTHESKWIYMVFWPLFPSSGYQGRWWWCLKHFSFVGFVLCVWHRRRLRWESSTTCLGVSEPPLLTLKVAGHLLIKSTVEKKTWAKTKCMTERTGVIPRHRRPTPPLLYSIVDQLPRVPPYWWPMWAH